MEEHLALEDDQVFKVIHENITRTQFQKDLIPLIVNSESKAGNLERGLCWFLSSDPEHADEFLNELPPPPRFLYRNFWKPAYDKEYLNLLPSIFDPTIPSPPMNNVGCQCTIM